MRWFFFAALAVPLPAAADLYRWVDPQTGSVKFSNVAPDWYGDPRREGITPRVEVLRDQGPATAPSSAPAAESSPTGGPLSTTEARRRADESALAERLKAGLEAPLGSKPPAGGR